MLSREGVAFIVLCQWLLDKMAPKSKNKNTKQLPPKNKNTKQLPPKNKIIKHLPPSSPISSELQISVHCPSGYISVSTKLGNLKLQVFFTAICDTDNGNLQF